MFETKRLRDIHVVAISSKDGVHLFKVKQGKVDESDRVKVERYVFDNYFFYTNEAIVHNGIRLGVYRSGVEFGKQFEDGTVGRQIDICRVSPDEYVVIDVMAKTILNQAQYDFLLG